MATENSIAVLRNQNSLLNSISVNTVSVSTSLQLIILSELGDKKLTTIFLETVLILEGQYN